jgi:predicted nucleotide-binding protein
MFYHVRIDFYDSKLKCNQTLFDFDISDEQELRRDVIIPYLKCSRFNFNGVWLNTSNSEVRQIRIFRSERNIEECKQIAESRIIGYYNREELLPHKDLVGECTNIIKEVHQQLEESDAQNKDKTVNKTVDHSNVFIVHGHDKVALLKLTEFLGKVGLNPIVLSRQADEGRTIIEKFEKYSNVGFAIVLYTYCDDGKEKNESVYKKRARQNVVFEHGYMIAKLGREKVCALRNDDIEIPSDYQGVIFKTMDESGGWQLEIAKELKSAGYSIDLNALL